MAGEGAATQAPAAAADTALAGFSATVKGIIAEARQVLSSPEMMQIRHAQARKARDPENRRQADSVRTGASFFGHH